MKQAETQDILEYRWKTYITNAITNAGCWPSNSQSCNRRHRYATLTGNGKNEYLWTMLKFPQHESNLQREVHVNK